MERLSAERVEEESDTAPIQESSNEEKRKQHEDLLKQLINDNNRGNNQVDDNIQFEAEKNRLFHEED